jgi:hypothetical protein
VLPRRAVALQHTLPSGGERVRPGCLQQPRAAESFRRRLILHK